jgi:hypothetical protein
MYTLYYVDVFTILVLGNEHTQNTWQGKLDYVGLQYNFIYVPG